jgi:hypothetical protein
MLPISKNAECQVQSGESTTNLFPRILAFDRSGKVKGDKGFTHKVG